MLRIRKPNDNQVKKKSDARSFINPQIVIFLSSAPFMLMCPLVLIGLATGWPLDAWINNNKLSAYEETFETIPLPDGVTRIGETSSLIGGFDKTQGECDLISAKLITSDKPSEELSSMILENYQTLVDSESVKEERIEGFDNLFNSTVKLFAINKDEAIFNNDELNVNVYEAFQIENFNAYADANIYVFYMIENNAFESRDPRCTKEIEEETPEETEDQTTEGEETVDQTVPEGTPTPENAPAQ